MEADGRSGFDLTGGGGGGWAVADLSTIYLTVFTYGAS